MTGINNDSSQENEANDVFVHENPLRVGKGGGTDAPTPGAAKHQGREEGDAHIGKDNSVESSDEDISALFNNLIVEAGVKSSNGSKEEWRNAWQAVFDCMKERPEVLKIPYGGNLPLHIALSNRAPTSVVKRMIDLYEESLHIPAKNGVLAIHYAAAGSSVGVVNCMLEKFPKCAQIADKEGNLPIHYAAFCEQPIEVFEALCAVNKSCVRVKNHEGDLPVSLILKAQQISKHYPTINYLLDRSWEISGGTF